MGDETTIIPGLDDAKALVSCVDERLTALLNEMAYLLKVLEARANTVPKSVSEDDFPKVRDELNQKITAFLDIFKGEFDTKVSVVDDMFAETVIHAIDFHDEFPDFDPKMFDGFDEWLESGFGVGYIIPGQLIRNLDICENAQKIPNFSDIFVNTKDMLYIPTILSNTVGFFYGIVKIDAMNELLATLHVLGKTRDANLESVAAQFAEFQEAILSPALQEAVIKSDDVDSDSIRQAIISLVGLGMGLLINAKQFIDWVRDVASLYAFLFPELHFTTNTVATAIATFKA